jgi:hypothetical protein
MVQVLTIVETMDLLDFFLDYVFTVYRLLVLDFERDPQISKISSDLLILLLYLPDVIKLILSVFLVLVLLNFKLPIKGNTFYFEHF